MDDFYTYGNVDDLSKYLKKAQTLNTKLELCREKIDQFNMEETAFEWELTSYPLMQATVDKLNPFLGLYETSMEFMNKQKTWLEFLIFLRCSLGTISIKCQIMTRLGGSN